MSYKNMIEDVAILDASAKDLALWQQAEALLPSIRQLIGDANPNEMALAKNVADMIGEQVVCARIDVEPMEGRKVITLRFEFDLK